MAASHDGRAGGGRSTAPLFEDFLVVTPSKQAGSTPQLLYAFSRSAARAAGASASADVEARTAAVVQFCFPESAVSTRRDACAAPHDVHAMCLCEEVNVA